MKAMEVLMDEHRVIEGVLNSLETSVNHMESGLPVRAEFLLSAAEFIHGFADGCHHQKEEGILFKRMEEQGISTQGCPLGVMLAEHEAGRQYARALKSAALGIQSGDTSAIQRAIMSSRSYITLLQQHIYKEDHILFPMAEKVIPAEGQAAILEDFERIEHEEVGEGTHEKYLSMAEKLAREMLQ
ncbi:MAG TPA: hemerythrin domain-containing protein [Anaerolineales bacterium]